MSRSIATHIRSNVVGYLALFIALTTGTAYATHPGGANTISSEDIIDAEIRSWDIRDNHVRTPNLQNGAVNRDKLAKGAVTREKINNGAIDELKLANDAVTTQKLGPSAVATGNLAFGAVTKQKLANTFLEAVAGGFIQLPTGTTVNAGACVTLALSTEVQHQEHDQVLVTPAGFQGFAFDSRLPVGLIATGDRWHINQEVPRPGVRLCNVTTDQIVIASGENTPIYWQMLRR